MAKKKSFFGELFGNLADVGVDVLIGNLKTAANDAMDTAQKRIQDAVTHALKAATIFVLMIFGLVMALVGYAKYLDATTFAADGIGFVVVGVGLLVLGLLIQFFRK